MLFNPIYVIPPVLSLLVCYILIVVSLSKGLKKENIYFSLVSFWWSILYWVFISHHIFQSNINAIVIIERYVHTFYVFIGFIKAVSNF